MKKRLLVIAMVMSLIAGMVFASGQQDQEKYVMTIGHGSAVGSIEDLAVQRIAEKAAELSDGRLELQVFPAGQLGNFVSMMESTIAGSQDMVWGDLTWLGNVEKDYQVLSMGYAFRDQDHINAFMDSDLGDELKGRLMDEGLLLLRAHANSLPRVTVSKMPVNGPEDMKNVKMRVPGIPIFVEVWTAMETKPTSVNWGEVYLALSQGVVDAMECGFEFVYTHKFHEVAPYVTLTNHVRGLRGMLVNPAAYDRLPADLQAILESAAVAGEELYNQEVAAARAEHTEILTAEGAIISEVDLAPFAAKMQPLVEKLEGEGFWSPGLYDKIQAIK